MAVDGCGLIPAIEESESSSRSEERDAIRALEEATKDTADRPGNTTDLPPAVQTSRQSRWEGGGVRNQ